MGIKAGMQILPCKTDNHPSVSTFSPVGSDLQAVYPILLQPRCFRCFSKRNLVPSNFPKHVTFSQHHLFSAFREEVVLGLIHCSAAVALQGWNSAELGEIRVQWNKYCSKMVWYADQKRDESEEPRGFGGIIINITKQKPWMQRLLSELQS